MDRFIVNAFKYTWNSGGIVKLCFWFPYRNAKNGTLYGETFSVRLSICLSTYAC